MRKYYYLITIFVLFISVGCNSEPILHSQKNDVFAGRRSFEFNNFTLLIVDTGQEQATYELRNYTGNGLQAPFNELNMKIGNKEYKVTSKNVGNGQLIVNDVIYYFHSFKEHLLIDYSGKIVAEQGEVHKGLMSHTEKKTR